MYSTRSGEIQGKYTYSIDSQITFTFTKGHNKAWLLLVKYNVSFTLTMVTVNDDSFIWCTTDLACIIP